MRGYEGNLNLRARLGATQSKSTVADLEGSVQGSPLRASSTFTAQVSQANKRDSIPRGFEMKSQELNWHPQKATTLSCAS